MHKLAEQKLISKAMSDKCLKMGLLCDPWQASIVVV